MIPLITSIPPSLTRQADDGNEIGREYARACVQSWHNSGFDPVSVNSEDECVSDVISAENVRLITVKRDAKDQFGKPLVYLGDFMAVARTLNDGPVVITNADILLDLPDATKQTIAQLEPGHCVVSKRHDILTTDSRHGQEFPFGYDFFAFHTRDLNAFFNEEFVFGLPWWDHYLPIHMYLRGIRTRTTDTPFVFHLAHDERWEFDKWVNLGNKFLQRMRSETARSVDANGKMYARLFSQAVDGHTGTLFARFQAACLHLIRSPEPVDEIQMLGQLAAINVQWLDEQRLCV